MNFVTKLIRKILFGHRASSDDYINFLKSKYNTVLGGVGSVSIGNNVFIGVNSIILMNSEIGDNVIVGAGSVVHGKIPSNCVVAGSPAKVVCSIEEFFEKRKKRQYSEAVQIVKKYRARFKTNPPKESLPAYFFLFEPRENLTNPVFVSRLKASGNYEKSLNEFMSSLPMFESYEDFLKSID